MPGTGQALNLAGIIVDVVVIFIPKVGSARAAQTELSSVASALEPCQIPVSRLLPFPDRATCGLRAAAPATLSGRPATRGKWASAIPRASLLPGQSRLAGVQIPGQESEPTSAFLRTEAKALCSLGAVGSGTGLN